MTIKEIRERSGLSQGAFCKRYGIPKGTLCHWESGERKPPSYVLNLLERVVEQHEFAESKRDQTPGGNAGEIDMDTEFLDISKMSEEELPFR